MIEYIKYTINGQTYSLVNNGDGTWSKELEAPGVAGLYDLKLEIKQGGSITYIDSTDSRYNFFLEVIQDAERSADLIQHLPDFLQDVLEFQVLFNAENIEIDRLNSSIQKGLLDVFIRTASIERITRLETFLRYKGEGTLEQRRSYLLALMQKGKKLNEPMIKEVAKTITGSDCIVSFFGSDELNNPEPGQGVLLVQVLSPDSSKDYRYADIARALKPLAPAHIKLLVIKYFSTWEDIKNNFHDWNAVAAMKDWQAVKDYIAPQ
ncbi:DUF2313 domain-containing protein [Psychrobacillus sp. NEAU-3TGS]|uniref:putative phage tail protein n=1 Tax=Psychrobacillus sp. NEAU-3TGS TaxID=2995412 RepID=UPI002498B37F|nr:putative phage tail protein [Psychrobacillus sp. NEAU-3TGS]MDI2588035.1 DUF2313 domain-containing protein [Psychrobacillus sp. NEAU-3TGS]